MKPLATSCVDYLQEDGQDFWELKFFHYFEDSRSQNRATHNEKNPDVSDFRVKCPFKHSKN